MNKYEQFKQDSKEKLTKALDRLEYSYNKIQSLPIEQSKLDDETLETWESFTARFARVCDLFLMRFLKAAIKAEDPGFEGTLRDHLNQAHKIGLIDDPQTWLSLRELAHDIKYKNDFDCLSHIFLNTQQSVGALFEIRRLIF